jgi:chemotaxis protein methyltransferase CheR
MTSGAELVLRDAAFPALKQAAIGLTGMAYWSDKEAALAEVLARLLADRRMAPSLFARRLAVESGRGPETDALVSTVTVGETSFFRYHEQFVALEKVVVPERLNANRSFHALSVWSAGCSVGAEAYSLAILLRRSFAAALLGWRIHLLGTDIDTGALKGAAIGEYSDWILRDMPADLRRECFCPAPGGLRVRDEYRAGVQFLRHNLVTDPPPPALHGGFDIVLCRNVLMYFDPDSRARAIAGLHRALVPGGWLLVGHAETNLDFGGFEPIPVEGWILFRKKAPARAPPPPESPVQSESEGGEARLLLDRGQFVEAVAACRSWASDQPLEAEAHYHLGLAIEALSEREAVQAFRQAVFLAPAFALAHFHLLRLLLRRGDAAQAERHRTLLHRLLAGQPASRPLRLGGGLTAGELTRLIDRMGEES